LHVQGGHLMKKSLIAITLGLLTANAIASTSYTYKDCPSLATYKNMSNFIDTVPTIMPHYEEFSGKPDPYFHPQGNFWVVINHQRRYSDGGDHHIFYTGMIVSGSANDSRTEVLKNAYALMQSATGTPQKGQADAYAPEWDSGSYIYEMCLYSGFAGTKAQDMVPGTTIAEIVRDQS